MPTSDSFLNPAQSLFNVQPESLHSIKQRPLPKEFPKPAQAKFRENHALNDDLKKTIKAKLREEKEGVAAPHIERVLAGGIDSPTAHIAAVEETACVSDWSLLLEKLTVAFMHMQEKGIQTTTLFLEGDPFSGSLFEGSTITLTEYSTAPKLFNVHFSGSISAIELLQLHASELVTAFPKEKFGFAIHRVDTSLIAEKRLRHFVPSVTPTKEF